MPRFIARIRPLSHAGKCVCGCRGALALIKVSGLPKSRLCVRGCLAEYLRESLGKGSTIDDQAFRKLGTDIVLDILLSRTKGPKLSRMMRVLRRANFDLNIAARKLGLKPRSVEQGIRRWVAQMKVLSDEPEIREMYERFLC